MANTKLNDPVRLPSGEVTTLAKLDDEGRIEWRASKSHTGAACYVAELKGSRDGQRYTGWTVGKLAYQSRIGETIAL